MTPDQCPVLSWAASGGMALTGFPRGEPLASAAGSFALLQRVTDELATATRATGTEVRADPAELIAGRAALSGLTRQGQLSAGRATRLLPAADGWCAITLSRPADLEALPAILGVLGIDAPALIGRPAAAPDVAAPSADPADPSSGLAALSGDLAAGSGLDAARAAAWPVLAAAASGRTAAGLADAAQLLGVPAAALPSTRPSARWPPWRTTRLAAPSSLARLDGAVVADLSSMWAGPLCARLLGLAGARVIKVESADRPDGARSGDQRFYDWLHAGHESIAVPFRTDRGRSLLAELLLAADVVIEASRPRALAALGLAPDAIAHRPGQVWLSITGHGRPRPERVAFGDDAAVAGGLVGWSEGTGAAAGDGWGRGEPVFCADAIADPLTGAAGALAIARSLASGGGQLIDLPMRAVAACFAAAPPPDHGGHEVRPDGTVHCPRLSRSQPVLAPRAPRPPGGRAAGLGADTAAVQRWLALRH